MKGSTEGEWLLRCADAVQHRHQGSKPLDAVRRGGLLGVLLDQIRRRWRHRK